MGRERREVPVKQGSGIRKSGKVFGQRQKTAKMVRAGLYARVSTQDQQTLAHAEPSHARVCRPAWLDHYHAGEGSRLRSITTATAGEVDGSSTAQRNRCGVVWRLDRWGRSVTDLLATLQELEHLGVGFVSLTEALDLTTPAGRAMAGLLAVFAAFEREILGERVRAGMAHARQNGKQLGRPLTAGLLAGQIRKLHRTGLSKSEVSRRLNIGRTSVRRILATQPTNK